LSSQKNRRTKNLDFISTIKLKRIRVHELANPKSVIL
jgi:hypothetical protein